MEISTVFLRSLYAHMRDQALPAERVLSEAGLSPDQLATRERMELRALGTAVRSAHALGAGPALALELGSRTPALSLGIVGQLVAHCATLREALREAQHFGALLFPGASIALTERGKRAVVQCGFPPLDVPARQFAVELALGALVTVVRQFAGEPACPLLVRLPFPAPAHQADYEALFRCRLGFGAEAAELLLDPALLDLKQPFADVRVSDVLRHQAECLLTSESRAVPLYLRVRALLEREEALAGESSFGDLARKLGISRRSLRRKLAAEGRTFSGLLDDYRKEQALGLLVDLQMPLKQISERLGFSEPSAFHRAFKRWTGVTPIQFRSRTARNAA